ncbi:MAG: TonB-dependent receptor plug domain-containing protein, partial [Spirosomaceae bacterium]|nr:TonB-dependent receptor plug domain-containing protein [Spirosomataceae bacterium]
MKYIFLLNLLVCGGLFAQTDSTNILLNQVTVTANITKSDLIQTARNVSVISARQIEQSPVKTLDGILQYALGVDVRSRSPFGVQADVSIRGGNFEQTLVLIDGVKMNDPQTGHHSFNLPIPISQIAKIEVLQGGASRVFGPAAFSGVINIITKKAEETALNISLGLGERNLHLLGGAVNLKKDKLTSLVSAERISSNGYAYNTAFDRVQAFTKNTIELEKAEISLQAGFMTNKFGASNFYSPKFLDQYE